MKKLFDSISINLITLLQLAVKPRELTEKTGNKDKGNSGSGKSFGDPLKSIYMYSTCIYNF